MSNADLHRERGRALSRTHTHTDTCGTSSSSCCCKTIRTQQNSLFSISRSNSQRRRFVFLTRRRHGVEGEKALPKVVELLPKFLLRHRDTRVCVGLLWYSSLLSSLAFFFSFFLSFSLPRRTNEAGRLLLFRLFSTFGLGAVRWWWRRRRCVVWPQMPNFSPSRPSSSFYFSFSAQGKKSRGNSLKKNRFFFSSCCCCWEARPTFPSCSVKRTVWHCTAKEHLEKRAETNAPTPSVGTSRRQTGWKGIWKRKNPLCKRLLLVSGSLFHHRRLLGQEASRGERASEWVGGWWQKLKAQLVWGKRCSNISRGISCSGIGWRKKERKKERKRAI